MNAKSLLIPIAAFAVTVTGAQAFNSQVLEEAGLNDAQIEAFTEARELRKYGDKDGARDTLIEAGIDIETMKAIRRAMHEHRHEMREAIHEAIDNNDYNAFVEAVEGSPIADIVNTEADFEKFKEAHDLKESGDREAAKEIMQDLGFEKGFGKHGHGDGHGKGVWRGGHNHNHN